MNLKQAIKICLEAGVTVDYYTETNSSVWLPTGIFLEWFTAYEIRDTAYNLECLVAVENGVEYKCHRWKGE